PPATCIGRARTRRRRRIAGSRAEILQRSEGFMANLGEILAIGTGAIAGGTAAVGGVLAGSAAGTAGAAALTSGLAGVGAVVTGGMLAGLAVIAAAPIAGGAAGLGVYRLYKALAQGGGQPPPSLPPSPAPMLPKK